MKSPAELLLSVLACPYDAATLEVRGSDLQCPVCARNYRLDDQGIVSFISSEQDRPRTPKLLAEDYATASPDRLHQPYYQRKYRDKQAEYAESSALQEAVRRCRDAGPLAVDLASGHGGGFLPWLAPRVRDGAILIGTDACLPVISNWSRLLSTYRDNVFFLDVDLLREPPFRNDMIDVFSGVMVANAYNSDPLKHFTRLHSRLRPGGILVISEIFYDAASKTAEFLADHSNPYQSLERFLGMLQSIGFHADDVLPLRRQQGKICSGDGFPIDDQDWWSEQIIVAART